MYQVLSYIHENISERLYASETAEHFGYSKWHFCKKFHEYCGQTFMEYVRHTRISLAALDILKGDKVATVAMRFGYDSVGGFNKAFLKEYGCMPREYKKQAKESQLYYERRRNSMYKISDRCMMLREEAVHLKNNQINYAIQRNVYFCLGLAKAAEEGKTPDEIFAAGTANTLRKFTPYIAPGELIVGFNLADKGLEHKIPEDIEKDKAFIEGSDISKEDLCAFMNLDPKYIKPEVRLGNYLYEVPVDLTEAEQQAFNEWAAYGRYICSNHSVIGYARVLKIGFEGLLKEVEHYEALNGSNGMYRGMKDICSAALIMGEKYAAKAKELLESGAPEYNKEDLEAIINTCANVPRKGAKTFMEAVQAIWFAHIINTWEDTINANSIGRLDQILYPYYTADIEKGVLTKEEAFEIICCLWLKLYRDYDVQQSCVGGTNIDGSSAVNELSYMMLDATERLDFIRCLSVRFGKNTDKEFLKRALEVVGHVQKGVPFFFNDDVMIPALIAKGIEEEDAYNYTELGCVETLIPGKTNPHAVTGEVGMHKALEYVLGNGHSLMFPEYCPGVKTGEPESLDNYKKFYSAILLQLERILDLTCSEVGKFCKTFIAPKPYKSLLTEGCLETGKDFNDKGAKYDYYQIMLAGLPNLADSLAVIKKFVYDEKKYTISQLKDILVNNFPDEAVRLEFMNKAPKFGNDIEEVDNIAIDLLNFSCDKLEEFSVKYGMSFHAQPFSFLWMFDHGKVSAASPDGRRKGEVIAYSVSPMQGRDFNGLTAVLNSVSKLPTKRTPGSTSAIIEVDPKLFTDKNIGIITDILIAAGKKGLSNVQFNTIDADTLKDAQKNPEKYNNLAVRVSGFSQKFNLLDKDMQNHIIGRTKHACL